MDELKVKQGTWHHRLYHVYGGDCAPDNTNLCRYMRGVVRGLALALLCVVGGVLVGVVVLEPFIMVVGWLHIGVWDPIMGRGVPVLLAIDALVLVLVAIGFTWYGYSEKLSPIIAPYAKRAFTDEDGTVTTLGLFKAWIKGKHDKICFNIDANS